MVYTLLAAATLLAQSVPKAKASDYPAHLQMDAVTLAAEYRGHSLPTPRGIVAVNEYLIVEVAFYGPPMARLRMSPDNFTLKINGHGSPLAAQLPGLVAGTNRSPIQLTALPEGEKVMPRSGMIYFARRKVTNIHKLQLFYDGPMGKYSLKLVP